CGIIGAKQLNGALRCLLYDFALGQFITVDRILGRHPKIAALLTQRILKQQRVVIERLLLNFRETQRLRLGKSRVSWAALADLGPQLLILVSDGCYLFGGGVALFGSVLTL